MTTELQVRTITFEPAKIEFNFDQLSAILDESLVKYAGLEFTEKDVASCKKTIAELRKGKTMLDTYRKDTKKELTESVTAFENKIKELSIKFDAVINPLTEQHDQFESDRKERKRREIQEIIDALITEQGLNEKFADQLIIPDEYFNKGKSIKEIRTELTALATSVGITQDKEAADVEIIKTKVELANAKNSVNLLENPYVNLLMHEYTINDIVNKINADAETLKQREVLAKMPAETPKPSWSAPAEDETIYVELFQITGTESQLQALEDFLQENELTWKVIEND
jgi:hypothetical protein